MKRNELLKELAQRQKQLNWIIDNDYSTQSECDILAVKERIKEIKSELEVAQ